MKCDIDRIIKVERPVKWVERFEKYVGLTELHGIMNVLGIPIGRSHPVSETVHPISLEYHFMFEDSMYQLFHEHDYVHRASNNVRESQRLLELKKDGEIVLLGREYKRRDNKRNKDTQENDTYLFELERLGVILYSEMKNFAKTL